MSTEALALAICGTCVFASFMAGYILACQMQDYHNETTGRLDSIDRKLRAIVDEGKESRV